MNITENPTVSTPGGHSEPCSEPGEGQPAFKVHGGASISGILWGHASSVRGPDPGVSREMATCFLPGHH